MTRIKLQSGKLGAEHAAILDGIRKSACEQLVYAVRHFFFKVASVMSLDDLPLSSLLFISRLGLRVLVIQYRAVFIFLFAVAFCHCHGAV